MPFTHQLTEPPRLCGFTHDRSADCESAGDGAALSGHEIQGVRLGLRRIIEMGQRVVKGTTH